MADIRISELPAAVSASVDDLIPVTQSSTGPATGVSRKMTLALVAALMGTQPNTLALQKASNLSDLADAATARTNLGLGTMALQGAGGVAITGGTIEATSVGAVTPAAGAFTTLAASGTVSGAGFTPLFASPPAIGSTTPSSATLTRLLIASSGTPAALPRMFQMTSVTGNPGAGTSIFRVGGNYFGALTGSLVGVWQFVMDTDNMTVATPSSMGVTVFDVAANLTTGWSGGRTLAKRRLNVNGPGTGPQGSFQVADAAFATSNASAGGTVNARAGSLFGSNISSRIQEGSGRYWRSSVGLEINTGLHPTTMALDQIGLQIVRWATGTEQALRADSAIKVGMQKDTTTVGWRTFLQLAGEDGWWPGTSTSALLRVGAPASGGPALALGAGLFMPDITWSGPQLRTKGAQIDAAGEIGGLTLGGKKITTRSEVAAATGVVASVTLVDRGLFSSDTPVTLTFSAPPDSGTTAAGTVASYALDAVEEITAPGSGYVVGDLLELRNGTYGVVCALTVDQVGASGALEGAVVTDAGSYTGLPADGATLTTISGVGSGAAVTMYRSPLTISVGTPGTNYAPNLPPEITWGGSTLRRPLTRVVMTETAALLVLNSGADTSVGKQLRRSAQALTATGTAQGTAAAITGDVVAATASASNTGVILPAGVAGMKKTVWRLAASSANLLIYPATGEEIYSGGALGANNPVTLVAAEGIILECVATGVWAGVAFG